MWNEIIDFIKFIEPLIMVVIPFIFGIWIKLKFKLVDEKNKINNQNKEKNKKKFSDWHHEESIRVLNKLKESCNYYCDLNFVHTSFLQLENGTLATSQICNMFFSCVAEDNRYSDIKKLLNTVQRIPFTRLSNWFNSINDNEDESKVVYLKEHQLDDIFLELGIRSMISGLVHDADGFIIGVCNFMFSDDISEDEIESYKQKMINFVTSIETIFLGFRVNLKYTKEKLGIIEKEDEK